MGVVAALRACSCCETLEPMARCSCCSLVLVSMVQACYVVYVWPHEAHPWDQALDAHLIMLQRGHALHASRPLLHSLLVPLKSHTKGTCALVGSMFEAAC